MLIFVVNQQIISDNNNTLHLFKILKLETIIYRIAIRYGVEDPLCELYGSYQVVIRAVQRDEDGIRRHTLFKSSRMNPQI